MKSDAVKGMIAEWILTNGELAGFKDKVAGTLGEWDVVGPGASMVVYRGQGGKIANITGELPSSLKVGVRPILATSKVEASVLPYTGGDCCIFHITLGTGTRYLDVNKTITFRDKDGNLALGVKKPILLDIASRTVGWSGKWPNRNTAYPFLRDAILERCCKGSTSKGTPPEEEILVSFSEGTVSPPVEAGKTSDGKTIYTVTYTPSSGPIGAGAGSPASNGGRRGRTFRRTFRRRDKNGGRPTRKSKPRRHK